MAINCFLFAFFVYFLPTPADALVAKWLSYSFLVKSHGATYHWGLDRMQGLDVFENYSSTGCRTANAHLEYNLLMTYECETSHVLNLTVPWAYVNTGDLLSDFDLLSDPQSGFTIDGFVVRQRSYDEETLISSWGENAQRWRVYWTEGQFSFQWGESDGSGGYRLRQCRSQEIWDYTTEWVHVAVRYLPTSSSTANNNAIQFFINGVLVGNDPAFYCGNIANIASNGSLPVTIGAMVSNNTDKYPEGGFSGLVAKLSIYPTAVSDAHLLEHYARMLATVGPCYGHGNCDVNDIPQRRCICYPIYFGENCTESFNISSVTPKSGSYYGYTTITIAGKGLLRVSSTTVHIRIGPTLMSLDNWDGAKAIYSNCTLVDKQDNQIICTTNIQLGRGVQNVSVVAYESTGYPRNRPVFSQCAAKKIDDCYFKPDLQLTARAWSYDKWAVPGSFLSFRGQYFTYTGFTVKLGDSYQCTLDTSVTYNDTYFRCQVPTNIPSDYYPMTLIMTPNGGSFPLTSMLFVHPNVISIYPLYPLPPRNAYCPTTGQAVQILPSNVEGLLNDTQIRIYEAPCYRRRTQDFLWLAEKVPLEYWQTYGYDMCPPYLETFDSPLYIPSAFTLHNTFDSPADLNEKRRERRFYDAQGNDHCLLMEIDMDI